MRLSLRVGFLVLAMSLIGSARAEANIWDWLSELDGPGPSRSRGNFMLNLICGVPADSTNLAGTSYSVVPMGAATKEPNRLFGLPALRIPDNPNTRATCLFVDFRALHAEDDANFYPVTITITELGTSIWVHKALEIGGGAGVMTFSSQNPVTNTDFNGARLTITFPRLVFRPLLAAPWNAWQNKKRLGFLQLYFKESIVVGNVNQGDFASKPGVEFGRRHQRVRSMGFIIDLVTLFGRTAS